MSDEASVPKTSSFFSAQKIILVIAVFAIFIFVSNGFWDGQPQKDSKVTEASATSESKKVKQLLRNDGVSNKDNNDDSNFLFNDDKNDPSKQNTKSKQQTSSPFAPPSTTEQIQTKPVAENINNKNFFPEKSMNLQEKLADYLLNHHRGKQYQGVGNEFKSLVPIEAFMANFIRGNKDNNNNFDVQQQKALPSNVSSLFPLSAQEAMKLQYIQMVRGVPPGLGLTTQLLTYLHLLAAAQFAKGNRILIFPTAERIGWFTLINMSATTFPGPAVAYIASPKTETNLRSENRDYATAKSLISGKTKWSRENAQLFPAALERKMHQFYGKATLRRVLVVPEMFKRYPFAVEPVINFGKLLCGIVFHSKIELMFLAIMDKLEQKVVKSENKKENNVGMNLLNENSYSGPFPWSVSAPESSAPPYFVPKVRYISLHLRLESQDSVAFRRKNPSADQLANWLSTSIVSLCQKYQTPNVFIASGPLSKEFEAVLKSGKYEITKGVFMNIFRKEHVLSNEETTEADETEFKLDPFFHEGQTTVRWEKHIIYPTNTKMAAVDALVLQHGVAAVMTAFSSLTSFIFARRCYDGPRCLGKLYGEKEVQSAANNKFNNNNTKLRSLLGPSTLYLYDIGTDGQFTKVKPFKCGYRMGELIRGGGTIDPPEQDDLFHEGERKNSSKNVFA